MRRRELGLCTAAFAAVLGFTQPAQASTAIEYPDNGVAQFSRGGAWLATATDPIAGYFNPAALATQSNGFAVGANFVRQEICFTRLGPDNDGDGAGDPIGPEAARPDLVYPKVCNINSKFPRFIPNLGGVWRVHERVGIGITVTPPTSFGKVSWPDTVTATNSAGFEQQIASPQRYLSLGLQGTILYPTLGVGVEVFKGFRVGAGFVSGIVDLELQTVSMGAVSPADPTDDFRTDTKSDLHVTDFFVPGFVVSAHASPHRNFDFAVWYKWFDKVNAFGPLQVRAPFYGENATGTTPRSDCESPEDIDRGESCAAVTLIPESATRDSEGRNVPRFGLSIPMEIRGGVRFHIPFSSAGTALEQEKFRKDDFATRDPLRDDVFDIEVNVTWAQNSESDFFTVRFPSNPRVNVEGSPGGQVPSNADRPTGFQDSIGVRLGGQWSAMRNKLGVRYGTWIESPAVKDEDLTVTGVPALRGGFGGGVVFRIDKTDVEVGYQRHWNAGLNNGGACRETTDTDPIETQTGCGRLTAIAGSGNDSADLTFANRSFVGVNGGKVSQNADVFSIGFVSRW